MSNNHHCLQCGEQMEWKLIEDRPREKCPTCGRIYYQHLRIGAGTVVNVDNKILLAKRAVSPWKGSWNLPAGFCEVDEHPEQTALRETMEETGLEVEIVGIHGLYFFDDDPRGNGLVVLYYAQILDGELTLNGETTALQFFSSTELPDNIAGGGHRDAIEDWINKT